MALRPSQASPTDQAASEFVSCRSCLLRRNLLFRPLSGRELGFVAQMRSGQLSLKSGALLNCDGPHGTFYTLYDGWAARTRSLADGSRQILDLMFPGDLFGLSAVVLRTNSYAVLALTDLKLCALDATLLMALFSKHPALALSVLDGRLEDQERADARIASLGRMEAGQRIAHLLLDVRDQLRRRGMCNGDSIPFPLQRTHVADAVGLSRVHVIRALRSLRRDGLAAITRRTLTIPDVRKLARYCGYQPPVPERLRAIL